MTEDAKDLVPIKIKQADVPSIFTTEAVEYIVGKVREAAVIANPDVGTDKGRKEIASMAAKVARSKVFLDDRGKDLVSVWKEKAKVVDSLRKTMRDDLDLLKREVRKPLTDWETEKKEAEARELADIEDIRKLIIFSGIPLQDDVQGRLDTLNEYDLATFDCHHDSAEFALAKTREVLGEKYQDAVRYEKEQEELFRLRVESERLAKQVREDEIRREAEERIRAEQEAEKARIKQERFDAIERAEQAEIREKEAKEQAKKDAELAEAAKLEAILKAEALRSEQILLKQEAEKKEREKREADKAHRESVHADILNALHDITDAVFVDADLILTSLLAGDIPHVTINY